MSSLASFITGVFTLSSTSLSGVATVVDGDTLRLNNTRIRLWGIDAPELSQPCGPQAAAKLRELTREPISCTAKATDRFGRTVAICYSQAYGDLARAMVAAGFADDYYRYSRGYYAQVHVKDHCSFSSPEAWRHKR